MSRLADPVRLGRREVRNRLVFGPHETNLARRRALSDRHVAYYRERAAGGAGVVVVEEASVHDSDWPYERAPLAAVAADGWSAIARACNDEGALVVAALGHTGGQGSSAYHQQVLWAPSRVPDVETREVPKEMEPEDVAEIVSAFAIAAGAAVAAGCDGVELNAGQHSLLRQFCSGLTNLRDDELGADRAEFARRVVRSVRAALDHSSPEAVLGLRLSCDELAPWAGIVPEVAATLAASLAAEGLDYLVVVRGSGFGAWATRPDSHVEPGFNRSSAATVKAALPSGVALVAQGSIVDVPLADELLAAGEADLVEMTRAQIADPRLGAKVARAMAYRIRPCVLCNQMCRVRDVRNPLVSCIGEPRSGHETTDPVAEPPLADPPTAQRLAGPQEREQPEPESQDGGLPGASGRPARLAEGDLAAPGAVLVVGGGVAGLECARVAALAGHQVTLVERDGTLGGMARAAALVPGRERLDRLADWLEAECRLAGAELVTGREVTLEEVDAHQGPVVCCTGSRRGRRTYEVLPGTPVATAADVLVAERQVAETPPSPVVVWDPIGGPIGIGVAELLAAHGASVTLVTGDHVAGEQLARTGDLAPANVRLQQRSIALVRRSVVREVGPDGVTVEARFSSERQVLPAALLVDAGHLLPEDQLWRATGAAGPRAGDCVAPRTVHEAVLEGRRAALALGPPAAGPHGAPGAAGPHGAPGAAR